MKKTPDTSLVCDIVDMSIGELVQARTGMDETLLMHDDRIYNIPYLEDAVNLFTDCAKQKCHMHIHTDYDGDGWGCAFILHALCKSIGVNHEVYLPDRETDGYGIKPFHVEKYLHPGDLLILADNGITAHDAIDKAKSMGCKVIVLDHHEGFIGPKGDVLLPNADVVVDPHVTGGDFKDYCGAGLCFRFAKMFYENRCAGIRDKWEPILDKMNVAAAISTMTDCVNLTDENRRIVKDGFDKYSNGCLTTGLKALTEALWLPKTRQLTGDDISFTLGPAINACGRLLPFGAKYVYELSILDGPDGSPVQASAKTMAKKVVEVNKDRKALTKKYSLQDFENIDANELDKNGVVTVFREGTASGLDGIRAGNIAEEYGSVAFVFSRDDRNPGTLKGSGRTAGDIDVKHLLDQTSHLLLQYGGHKEACGLSLKEELLGTFTTEANRFVHKEDISVDRDLHYDIEAKWEDVPDLIDELNAYGPFGTGNPAPKFYIKDIPVGKGYVPKSKNPGGKDDPPTYYMGADKDSFCGVTPYGMKVVGFNGLADEFRSEGEPGKVSVICTLSQDEKRGIVSSQINIEAFTMDVERNMAARNEIEQDEHVNGDDMIGPI